MTDVAVRQDGLTVPDGAATSPLVLWAYEARQAAQIASSLSKTSFVPKSFQGRPEDITAAILAGQELGLQPMASLRSMDIVQGTPALRAHAMRGLVQSRGHEIQLVESTETRCKMRGRRKGEGEWQSVTWTIDRATKLGLTGREQWRKQPATMLVARATSEICRLVAADVLYAMPYSVEELDSDLPESIVAREPKRRAQRKPVEPTPMPEPEFMAPDEPEPESEVTGDTPPDAESWDEDRSEPAQPPLEAGDAPA